MTSLRIGVLKDKLVSLCALTGVGSSGTKQELMTRLVAELYNGKRFNGSAGTDNAQRLVKVVSIDMGIRNISISQFLWRVPNSNLFYFPPHTTRDLSTQVSQSALETNQGLLDQALLAAPSVVELVGGKIGQEETSLRLVHWDRLDLDTIYSPAIASNGWEPYGPAHICHIAQNLLHDHILANPHDAEDIVLLLERQRFRSGGASQVLEWTLRVNMLELALFSGATTVGSAKLLSGLSGKRGGKKEKLPGVHVYSIGPKRVVGYWREQFPQLEVEESGNSYRDNKQWKINVAARVLRECQNEQDKGVIGPSFFVPQIDESLSVQVQGVMEAGREGGGTEATSETARSKGKKGEPKTKRAGKPKKSKVDDLADSFLQGLAWMGFQQGTWNMAAAIGLSFRTKA